MKKIASENKDYRGLIKQINEVRKAIKERNTEDGITFTTIHASKGLQYHVCIVLGVCDRLYPFYRAVQENGQEGMEEEARLFYVASTRPIERLYYSEIHGMFGKFKVLPSPFAIQSQRQILGDIYGKESIESYSKKDFFGSLYTGLGEEAES
jgi:superfamily I DNA/RNA helicase